LFWLTFNYVLKTEFNFDIKPLADFVPSHFSCHFCRKNCQQFRRVAQIVSILLGGHIKSFLREPKKP
jgi:hypothetical protein